MFLLFLILFFRLGFLGASVVTEQLWSDQATDEQAGDEDSIQEKYFFTRSVH